MIVTEAQNVEPSFLTRKAFVAEAAFLFGESQFPFGPVAVDRFLWVED